MKRVTAFLTGGMVIESIIDIIFWAQPLLLCLGSIVLIAIAATVTWKRREDRVSSVVLVTWGVLFALCMIAGEARKKRGERAVGGLVDGVRNYTHDHDGITPETLEVLEPRYVKTLPTQGPIWCDVWDLRYSRERSQACVVWSPFISAPRVDCVEGKMATSSRTEQ